MTWRMTRGDGWEATFRVENYNGNANGTVFYVNATSAWRTASLAAMFLTLSFEGRNDLVRDLYELPEVPTTQVMRVADIFARPRRQGGGSAVMAEYCRVMDKLGWWVVLEPVPSGEGDANGPTQTLEGLLAFYASFGFVLTNKGVMFRPPIREVRTAGHNVAL